MRRLLIRPGAIGDLVLSLPALEFLRAPYTEVWVQHQNVPLIRFADRVRAIPDTGLDLLEITGPRPDLIESLRSFDDIVSWYGASRDEFRHAVAALHLPCRFFDALPNAIAKHATDFYLTQVGAPLRAVPHIPAPAAARTFAVIHPFSGSPSKNWPLSRFQEVAAALSRDLPVHWCAGPEEELPGAFRFDSLYDLACWLARARVYIGNDSGPTHIAAAVGTPVVALFGPTDPRVWAARGPQVQVLEQGREPISVEDVLGAARAALIPA